MDTSKEYYGDESWAFEAIQREVYPDEDMIEIINQELNNADRVLAAMSGSVPLGGDVEAEVVGLDQSREMIKLGEAKRVQGNVEHPPFEQDSFDGMYITGTSIHYLDGDQLRKTFEEAERVLSPNSPLIVDYFRPGAITSGVDEEMTVKNDGVTVSRFQNFEDNGDHFEWEFRYVVKDGADKIAEYGPKVHKMNEYSKDQIESVMVENGFEAINSFPVNSRLFDTVLSDYDKLIYTRGYASEN